MTNNDRRLTAGSLANPMRFLPETVDAVRDAVGDTCAIALRIAVGGRAGAVGSTAKRCCR